jgi:hypothetical protein
MPIARPGTGMSSMSQGQMQNDVIKRPPGFGSITGGAPASASSQPASQSKMSDLERQMEQQYGR